MNTRRHSNQSVAACGRLVKELRGLRGYTVEELLAVCTARDRPINEREYRDWEAGLRIPDNPEGVIETLSTALSLTPTELQILVRALGFAIVTEALGPETAAHIFPM